ncbi:hypothetical protein C8J56DRAFT_1046416 [Mycena floridula]|nr:hypothetical protein C8J56DRAFT_1046416 [Mycena floridula]
MSRTKATERAKMRALGFPSPPADTARSSRSPGPPNGDRMSSTAKRIAAAKKSTANARAGSPHEPEERKTKYGRYYENNRFKRKQDANNYYHNVGKPKRQAAAAAKKAAKGAGLDAQQSPADEESLAYTTIRKIKQDMMVWKIRDGGFEVWREWEENDERRVDLKREGEIIWFRAISLFQHYEPPRNVDEAVQIYNISVEVMSMLRIGLQAL